MDRRAMLVALALALAVTGCSAEVNQPQGNSDGRMQQPPAAYDMSAGPSQASEPVGAVTAFDCTALLAQIRFDPGSSWEKAEPGRCMAAWSHATQGLRVTAQAWKVSPSAPGHWTVAESFPVVMEPGTVSVEGENEVYQGIRFHLPPESTGGEFWGPVPIALALAGSRGGVSVECSITGRARNKAEGDAAQVLVDGACPGVLSAVKLGDLGEGLLPILPPRSVQTVTTICSPT